MFVTKKNLTTLEDWDSVVYPVAYFEDGVPWFATPVTPRLRKPTPAEDFWGALASPGQNTAALWNEVQATNWNEIQRVRAYLIGLIMDDELAEDLEGKKRMSFQMLRAYADEEHLFPAVDAALSLPDFQMVSGDGGTMYWTLTEKS
jgi:hypothetical protein